MVRVNGTGDCGVATRCVPLASVHPHADDQILETDAIGEIAANKSAQGDEEVCAPSPSISTSDASEVDQSCGQELADLFRASNHPADSEHPAEEIARAHSPSCFDLHPLSEVLLGIAMGHGLKSSRSWFSCIPRDVLVGAHGPAGRLVRSLSAFRIILPRIRACTLQCVFAARMCCAAPIDSDLIMIITLMHVVLACFSWLSVHGAPSGDNQGVLGDAQETRARHPRACAAWRPQKVRPASERTRGKERETERERREAGREG
jgi:hypothetical protein